MAGFTVERLSVTPYFLCSLGDLNMVKWIQKIPSEQSLMDLNIFRLSVNTPNVYVKPKREQYIRNPIQQKIQHFKRFIENYRRHIVCFMIVYGITAGVALERCYCEWKSFFSLFCFLAMSCSCIRVRLYLEDHTFLASVSVLWSNPSGLIKNIIFRLRSAGRKYRHPWDFSGGHHRLPWLGGRRLLSLSLHAPHRVSQPHHPVPRDLPQPIHPLWRCHRFPSLHGHDCHHPYRLADRRRKYHGNDSRE